MRFLLFFILSFCVSACFPENNGSDRNGIVFQKETVRIVNRDPAERETLLTVEIADTDAKRMRGLMYRSELPENAGMLFLFPVRKRISMWMANTSIPLDMIFLDDRGTVTEIVENTVPLSRREIRSADSVKGVLEIGGGRSKKLGIEIGDKLDHPFFKLEKKP